jgi:predicted glycoside hydrolase/deacetylase ChbG (UPF0249 family)
VNIGRLVKPTRLLVVTADDFGIGLETSRGIVDTARNGPVTATSAIVVADACEASLPVLDEVPGLELGLHVALTGRFRPLVATRASGFVGRDGRFGDLWRLVIGCITRRVSRAALWDEITAQADRLRRLTGRPLVHFDGHHHAHELPLVREVVAELSQQGRLPSLTRVTTEPARMRRLIRGERLRRTVVDRLGRQAGTLFAAEGLGANDTAFGTLCPSESGGFPWREHLASLPDSGVVEWIVHPGRPDPTLRSVDSYVESRVTEWRALTAPAHRGEWERLAWPRAGKSCLRARAE